MQMNLYEQSVCVLQLCPIPQSIQQLIYYTLVGYGTPASNAIQTMSGIDETLAKVAIFSPLNRNIRSLNALKKVSYYYNKPSYFSRCALYELHRVYLSVNRDKYSDEFRITRCQDMQNLLDDLTKKKLTRLIVEKKELTFGKGCI